VPRDVHDDQLSEKPQAARPSPVRSAVIGVTVSATILVVLVHRATPVTAIGLGLLVVFAGWLSVIDFEQHRLPNRIIGPLTGAVTVVVVLAGLVNDDLGRSGRALLIGLAASIVMLVGNLIGGMGMGDVKYAFPLAATLGWFGLSPVLAGALVMAFTGGLAALVVLIIGKGRGHRLAYGPFMSLGLIGGLLTAAPGV